MLGELRTPAQLKQSILLALVVARREVKDTIRDWRLVIPIAGLTLFFPGLMIIVAGWLSGVVENYSSDLLGARSLPILLMVVGFFPTSFSLVIALEAFVGEKERKSLEPLLATPLTNHQLFVGKLLAAVLPPVMASYVGIAFYALGVTLIVGPMPGQAILLVVMLTTIQALLMVSASVVVSSQATSTRAANMLASFIIVPVSLLLQLEAFLMAFENYAALWWMMAAVFVIAIIFVRIGVQIFNRENLLGRNIDFLNMAWIPRAFARRFLGRDANDGRRGLGAWYVRSFDIIRDLKLPIFVLSMMFIIACVAGAVAAGLYQLPEEFLTGLRSSQTQENIGAMQEMFGDLPLFIFSHNMRAILILVILGSFTFGVSSVLIYMLPWTVIAFITAQFAMVGENPFVFISATVLPHAWVELPILLLVTAAALRWQASVIAPPNERKPLGEIWVQHAADFSRIMVGYGVPLFLIAALLESFVTPVVIGWVYG
ncbi:MAG: stage II sporulation protein M [Chloroflexota bacterium]